MWKEPSRVINSISVLIAISIVSWGLYCLIPRNEIEVMFITPQNADQALGRVLYEINRAARSIDIAMYMITNPQIAAALAAKSKDVAVRILYGESSLLPGKQVPGLHIKLCVIDNKTAIVGSANFTDAAFGFNHEVIVILPARKFLEYFKEQSLDQEVDDD